MCAIPVPFDPKAAFGKVRAPVRVTLNGYTFRSTIAAMGGPMFIPFRRSHREAARLEGTETLSVTLALDTATRTVTPPADLVRATTYYVTIAGLGGEPDYEKRFAQAAADIEKLVAGSGEVMTIRGLEAKKVRINEALAEVARKARPEDAFVLMLIGLTLFTRVERNFLDTA